MEKYIVNSIRKKLSKDELSAIGFYKSGRTRAWIMVKFNISADRLNKILKGIR